MNIEIFNETDEVLEKELNELKDMLSDYCIREKLDNVIFNIIIVDNKKIQQIY